MMFATVQCFAAMTQGGKMISGYFRKLLINLEKKCCEQHFFIAATSAYLSLALFTGKNLALNASHAHIKLK